MIRKRYAILLEVMIASVLAVLVLSSLTFFYRQVEWTTTRIERLQEETLLKLHLQSRLANVLPRTVAPTNEKKDFYFYSSSDVDELTLPGTANLLFTFDNQIKLAPQFSNNVLGRLFVDLENRLSLMVWPSPKRWEENAAPPSKREILLENVSKLNFEFYVPPIKDRKKGWEKAGISKNPFEGKSFTAEGSWVNEWPQSYQQLPALIKIHIEYTHNGNDQALTLTYPLPQTLLYVYYDRLH